MNWHRVSYKDHSTEEGQLMTKIFTLAIWGRVNAARGWTEWFRFMEESSTRLDSPLTHFGVSGDRLGTKGIRPIDKFAQIQNAIELESVEWLSGYSLPDDFQTAAYDYNVHMNRCKSYISISAKEGFAGPLIKSTDDWLNKTSKYCYFVKGMLFHMNEDESPLFFVSGASPPGNFRSLEILREFT